MECTIVLLTKYNIKIIIIIKNVHPLTSHMSSNSHSKISMRISMLSSI